MTTCTTPSDYNVIHAHRAAAAEALKALLAQCAQLQHDLEVRRDLDLDAIRSRRDECKALWSAFALKTRQLDDAAKRVALQPLRAAILAADRVALCELLFEVAPDSPGVDDILVGATTEYRNAPVVKALWAGLCRTLGLDPATTPHPPLPLPALPYRADGYRLRRRWLPLISDADRERWIDVD